MKTAYLRHPFFWTVLFLALIPLLPEYAAPFLAVASLFTAGWDVRRRHRVITVGPLGKLVLLYILYLAIGLIYSDNRWSVLSTLGMWTVMFAGYVALQNVLINQKRLNAVLLALSIGAGLVGLIAGVQYLMRVGFGFDGHLQLWYPLDNALYTALSPVAINMEVVGNRACATFNNPNIMAEYLIMVIPFVTLYAFTGNRSRSRMLSRLCLLLAVTGVWFSFSRGCYLALLAMAAVWTIANIQRISLIFLAGFSTLALTPDNVIYRLLSISPPKPGSSPSVNTAVSVIGGNKAINERLEAWLASLQSIKEHPLFGLGAGVGNTGDMLTAAGLKNVPHVHNIYLQLLAEGGLITLAIFGVAGVLVLRTGIRLIRHNRQNARVGAAILAFAVGFCVMGMVDFPLFCPKLVGIFLLVIALIDSTGRLELQSTVSPLIDTVTLSRFRFARKVK